MGRTSEINVDGVGVSGSGVRLCWRICEEGGRGREDIGNNFCDIFLKVGFMNSWRALIVLTGVAVEEVEVCKAHRRQILSPDWSPATDHDIQ